MSVDTSETFNNVSEEPPRVLNPETTRSVHVALPNVEIPVFLRPVVLV